MGGTLSSNKAGFAREYQNRFEGMPEEIQPSDGTLQKRGVGVAQSVNVLYVIILFYYPQPVCPNRGIVIIRAVCLSTVKLA